MHDCENANQGLFRAGVRHVAFQIWPIDESVLRNHKAFREQGTLEWFRARGFTVGGFVVNYFTPIEEAYQTIEQLKAWDLDFLVSDIERHKADLPGGNMELTETLADALTDDLDIPVFPVWFIGYGQHSAPSVVNHKAMDSYGIDYLDECYDENGYSDGVVAGIEKITREKPDARRHLPRQQEPRKRRRSCSSSCADCPAPGSRCWLWRPETGEAQHDLAAGIDLVP